MSPPTAGHVVQWATASPLWNGLLADGEPIASTREVMLRPALLRFDSDDFMGELDRVLATDPERLADHVAVPTSYRERAPGKPADWEPPIEDLKLYQPVHGHFNLVAGALTCRMPGLPDKEVASADGERVGFLLRRVGPSGELAWVEGEDGVNEWRELDSEEAHAVAEAEERLPMFPVNYEHRERRRRLFVGLIPTSSGESFKNAGVTKLTPEDRLTTPPDPRVDELDQRVGAPLEALRERVSLGMTGYELEASRFLLLDLAELLAAHLPEVWAAVRSGDRPAGSARAALYDVLDDFWADSVQKADWLEALTATWAQRDVISGEASGVPTTDFNLARATLGKQTLHDAFEDALPAASGAGADDGTGEAAEPPFDAPKLDPRPSVHYRLRCVYERPRCGPLHPPVVSLPSEEFSIAPFFDFDAPARSIQISLPVDTGIKDLRKFRRNVSFLISDQLKQQMSRVSNAKEALKGNLEAGEPLDIGVICSFSIPIITICALIVLLIFLFLLNIIFWWLPFFRLCFPIGLKAR